MIEFLPFQFEIAKQDGLIILPTGIGLTQISSLSMTRHLQNNHPGIFFILNLTAQNVEFLNLHNISVRSLIQMTPTERLIEYQKPGLIAVTSRTLIVDLLNLYVNYNSIRGVFVLDGILILIK